MEAGSLSRRASLLAACALCCALPARAQEATRRCPPVPVAGDPAAEQERHAVLLLLAMALVHDGWCIDRSRPELVAAYAAAEPGRVFNDYLGHNIGAVLVTPADEIVCVALNRNISCNSTLEHAEARAVQAGTALANAAPLHSTHLNTYHAPLRGDLLYTTLEPCAQCSGIMALAGLRSVIYLQDDPAALGVVNVLYTLSCGTPAAGAPVPVAADFLPFRARLQAAYEAFRADPNAGRFTGTTSFLGTLKAYLIYREAAATFDALRVGHEQNQPLLEAAQAFRKKWRFRMPAGGAPEAVRSCF
jgi:tRNA(Arg) A34 adenosine deaminase TadA